MIRALLLYLSHARWAQSIVINWRLARRVVRRFVAGETEAEAIDAVRALNAKGMTATIDVLGESITRAEDAQTMRDAYLHLLEAIDRAKVKASVSVKLTALGLDIDEALCCANLSRILETARGFGLDLTIDMESSAYTERTLRILTEMHSEGFSNVLGVIQSYLYRSDDDVAHLAGAGIGVRLCKGAYREPADVAYPKKADTDAAYERQMKMLLDASLEGRGYPGLATHDARLIETACAYADRRGIPRDRYEFQMLHGVRTGLQEDLVAQGYGMRVYVPFGTQWYPYFMRRLAENPANLWFFGSSIFKH